jgi:hypothetical protein
MAAARNFIHGGELPTSMPENRNEAAALHEKLETYRKGRLSVTDPQAQQALDQLISEIKRN